MEITVTATKTDWQKPVYKLEIDGVSHRFQYETSRILTNTSWGEDQEIFSELFREIKFKREQTTVEVDFGDTWDVSRYENPALEIARRVGLVNAAFEAVRESYERSFTVTI